ncbi:uncharacterized protein KY384_007923 [Bacidia gigantensis]|uniref:uncharacterized protein n=1 Tax=Bacidia gigantensis TaxID=2732470 RepID=UPI001D055A19|nr:uncharacterized protein KY384_007923 [Bacidia gigantensis]KAG8527769.1 hypothetical protein KY384_007923 [Bacidia gigantensis]
MGSTHETVTNNEISDLSTATSQVNLADKVKELQISSSLSDLQTDEQRRVLDTIAEVRKCGLDSVLSLPQIVVCGQQSSGKSSVLEALTEISFPRSDNKCTRFASEIILRRGTSNTLTIKVLPDENRPTNEKMAINIFQESIDDFSDLPRVMAMATDLMGIDRQGSNSEASAFARDVLRIEIEGPDRPQLTLVDIPGLIETVTKGVTQSDIDIVNEITDSYITQPRTICLAVIPALGDYATQRILTKVREVDPQGERTLGVITKPDRLDNGSVHEQDYINLAKNEDVFLQLGWHVIKNRVFKEEHFSLLERNQSEKTFFRTSKFNQLPGDTVGIENLRSRLSALLFEHVKRELPNLRGDLNAVLKIAQDELVSMGDSRSDANECRTYLSRICLDSYQTCKGGINGHYEGPFFAMTNRKEQFSRTSEVAIRRIRAQIQKQNSNFNEAMRTTGHKFDFPKDEKSYQKPFKAKATEFKEHSIPAPIQISREKALEWVEEVFDHTRGKELAGTFNPLLIGELFWEQSSKWEAFAKQHVEQVALSCEQFLGYVLSDNCPKDVKTVFWSSHVEDSLHRRHTNAYKELQKLIDDIKEHPINYNHYFTDTINKLHKDRCKGSITETIQNAYEVADGDQIDTDQLTNDIMPEVDPNMKNVSCNAALDSVYAIYKVMLKIFVSNVTTQVVERHIVRHLEDILSPLKITAMGDGQIELIAKENPATHRQRAFLQERIAKLQKGNGIFRNIMGSV